MSEPPSKCRRVDLTLDVKVQLLKESEKVPKPTLKVLSEKYGVGKSTVSDLLKKKAALLEQWENNSSAKKFRASYASKFDKLDSLVYEWFCQARAKNIPISGVLIQEKALHFSKELNIEDFKASNGWLGRWKSRHSVKGLKVCGESAGVDEESVDNYRQRLPDIIRDYEQKDVFNCDGTGLYYRALPDRTLASKGQAAKGTKVSKDRITVLFACSATGEKLRPLVIGKSENPRCLKNIKRETLGADYVANPKAWMNSRVFSEWLKKVNLDMKRQRRHILLFLDNASSHASEHFSNITLKFLPPNTTSVLQPLDQGIIRAFKALYRKNLLRSLLTAIDTCDSVQELCKKVSLLDAIGWLVRAWKDVKPETISRCFAKAGFIGNDSANNDAGDDMEDEDNLPLSVLAERLTLEQEEVLNFDDGLDTEDNTVSWEQALIDRHRQPEPTPTLEDVSTEEPDQPLPGANLTQREVLEMGTQLRNYAAAKDSDFLDIAQHLIAMTERKILTLKCVKQTTIKSFFQ